MVPRCGAELEKPGFRDPIFSEPRLTGPTEFVEPAGRVLLFGGVKGRNPPRFTGSATRFVPEFAGPVGRVAVPLLGELNGRDPMRFPFCTDDDGLPTLLLPAVFVARFENDPALGFCMVPLDGVPRAVDSPPKRPPAGTPPTWLRCIVCRRLACCCWNETGRAILLCADPKKRSLPPLRIVDGAAPRPLADRLARVGTTGRLPAIMRAPPNCWRVTATGLIGPPPNFPAPTADIPRPTCGS